MTQTWVAKTRYKKFLVKTIYLWITLFLASILMLVSIFVAYHSLQKERDSFQREATLFKLVSDFQTQFNLSTVHIRSFLITGQPLFFADYLRAVNTLKSLNNAFALFEDLHALPEEMDLLNRAKRKAENIRVIETHALKLLATAYTVNARLLTDEVNSYTLSAEDMGRTPEDKLRIAQDLLFGADYLRANASVISLLNTFQSTLYNRINTQTIAETNLTDRALLLLTCLLIAQIFVIASIIWLRAISMRKYINRLD